MNRNEYYRPTVEKIINHHVHKRIAEDRTYSFIELLVQFKTSPEDMPFTKWLPLTQVYSQMDRMIKRYLRSHSLELSCKQFIKYLSKLLDNHDASIEQRFKLISRIQQPGRI
jgi:hypothetical protein